MEGDMNVCVCVYIYIYVYVYILMADSYFCMAETNTAL